MLLGAAGASIFSWILRPWLMGRRLPHQSDLLANLMGLAARHPEQLDQLLGSMHDVLWVADLATNQLLFVSDSVLRIYGLSRDELQAHPKKMLERVHPDDKERVRDALQGLLRGDVLNLEHRLLWHTGEVYWIHVEAHRLFSAQGGQLVGGLSRDITAQKRLTEYWRASEERYRRLVSMADTCIMVLDEALHVLEWNEAAERIFGVQRAQAMGMSFLDHFVQEPDRQRWHSAWTALQPGSEIFRIELEVIGREASVHWISWNNRLYINPQNSRRELVAVGMDVTELHRVSRDLERNEQLFRSLFENAPTAMALIRDDGQLLRVNREYERFFETPAQQLLMRSLAERADAEGQRSLLDELQRLAQGSESRPIVRSYRTHEGATRWGNTWLRFHETGSDGRNLFLEQIMDVTDQRRVEEALDERKRQLRTMVSNLSGILYRYSSEVGNGVLKQDGQYRLYNLHHDWRPTFMSEGAHKITGFKAESFTRGDVFSFGHLIYTDDRAALIPRVERSINSHQPFELVYRIRGASSEVRWISERGRVFLDGDHIQIEGLLVDITSQKLAEESEQIYRQLVADTHTGFLALDGNGLVLDANIPFLEFLGVPRLEAIRDRSVYEWTAPESKETTARLLLQVSREGAVKNIEIDYLRADGKRVSLSLSAVATKGDHHVLIRCLLVDVTESRQAQQELVQSRNLLAESQRIAGLGSWVENRSERGIYWSEELYELLGYGEERPAASQELLLQRIHPEEREQVRARLVEGALEGISYSMEFRVVRIDHSLRSLRCNVSFELDGMGRVVRTVGVMQDVTASRDAEMAIIQSERRYRSLFDTSIDGICILSLEGVVEEANAAFLEIVGYNSEEIRGMPEKLMTPDVWHREDELIRSDQILKRGYCESYRKEYLRRDGRRVPVSVRQWLVRDQAQQPLRIMAMVRDITEYKKIESEREQLQRAMQQSQKMEAIGHLTGGIAHDFNNILTSILGYSDLALRQMDADPESRQGRYLRQIKAAGERARELIAQMLIFSRGGSSPGKVQAISMLVQSAIRMLRPTVPTSIRIRAHIDQTVHPVLVDDVQLQQVVMNLVINARDALGEKGEIRVLVREMDVVNQHCASCHARINGVYVELAVEDNGVGIEAHILHRIFDPFFTTKEVGKGSGMGLSVVHGIVHEFAGHILVNSNRQQGTSFRILFPCRDDRAAEEPMIEPLAHVLGPAQQYHVMVVDDDVAVAHMLSDLLTLQGYQVRVFTDPLRALESLEHDGDSVDILVTDQVMPGILGYDLARRALAVLPELRIIMLSAQADLIQRRSQQAIPWTLLSKPLDAELLLRTLRDVLEVQQPVDVEYTPKSES